MEERRRKVLRSLQIGFVIDVALLLYLSGSAIGEHVSLEFQINRRGAEYWIYLADFSIAIGLLMHLAVYFSCYEVGDDDRRDDGWSEPIMPTPTEPLALSSRQAPWQYAHYGIPSRHRRLKLQRVLVPLQQ